MRAFRRGVVVKLSLFVMGERGDEASEDGSGCFENRDRDLLLVSD